MARPQKKAQREGRTIALIDESGFMMQPPARRTWAPVGCTPELVRSARHDRVSAIRAITLSPIRQRLGLYVELVRASFNADRIESFVRDVQRTLGRPVTFVWDRLSAHRTVANRLAGDPRFEFVLLPAYSPILNPDEWVWRYAKHTLLANACPHTYDEMEGDVHRALLWLGGRSDLLRGFFAGAQLSLLRTERSVT